MLRDTRFYSRLDAQGRQAAIELREQYRSELAELMKARDLDRTLLDDPEHNKHEEAVMEGLLFYEEVLGILDLTPENRREAIVYQQEKIAGMQKEIIRMRELRTQTEKPVDIELLRKEIQLVKKVNEERLRLRFIKENA